MSPKVALPVRVNQTRVGCAVAAIALGVLVAPAPVAACTMQWAIAAPTAEMVALLAQAPQGVERDFELAPPKADAMFALLAPDDVKVLVSRRDAKVHVQGTRGEVGTLAKLVELITRMEGKDIAADDAMYKELSARWTANKEYKLPKEKADALFTILAFDDVPVLVRRTSSGVGVEASADDQKTIGGIAAIMMGKAPKVAGRAKKSDAKPTRKRAKRESARPRASHDDDHGDHAAEHDALIKWQKQLTKKAKDLEKQAKRLQKAAKQLQEELDRKSKEVQKRFADAGRKAPAEKGRRAKRDADGNPDEVIVRKYELPPHHAEHLFALFAPDDIRDVIVSRDGNVVEIRAARRDHRTIQQLVGILQRGAG